MVPQNQEELSISKGLLSVLDVLSSKQKREFELFLDFEPFDYNQRLRDFYHLLKKHFLQKKKSGINLIDELEKIGITQSQFNKFQTFLHQKLDQFLALQQIINQAHRYHSYTLEAYDELDIDFANKDRKARQINKKLLKDSQTLEHFEQAKKLEAFAIKSRIAENFKADESHYEEMHSLIDQNYILEKLKYSCASMNEAMVSNQPFPQSKIETLKAVMATHEMPLPPIGIAYRAIFGLMVDPKQGLEAYEAAFSEVLENQKELTKDDQFDTLNYLLNLSFLKVAVAEDGFVDFVVRIYRSLIESKLLKVEGEIPARTFKNIVSINCKSKNYDWCMDFIENNQKYLPEEDKIVLPQLCTGLVNFYAGNYLESSKIFRAIIQINPDDPFWGFESRNLLLKSYYHRFKDLKPDEYEDLLKLTDSFRMYARRNNDLSEFHRKSYLNFVRYFNQMLRHLEKHGNDAPFPKSLSAEVENLEFITNKNWLLQAILEKQNATG